MMGGGGAAPRAAGGPPPIAIAPADFQEFEQLLKASQAAWSARDLNALQAWRRRRWSATSPNNCPSRPAAA